MVIAGGAFLQKLKHRLLLKMTEILKWIMTDNGGRNYLDVLRRDNSL